MDDIIAEGLHEYLDELQSKINLLGNGIFETFFALKSPEPTRKAAKQTSQ